MGAMLLFLSGCGAPPPSPYDAGRVPPGEGPIRIAKGLDDMKARLPFRDSSPYELYERGRQLYIEKNYQAAMPMLGLAVLEAPRDSIALRAAHLLGCSQFAIHDHVGALEAFQFTAAHPSARTDSEIAEELWILAQIERQRGRAKEARDYGLEFIKRFPRDPRAIPLHRLVVADSGCC